MSRQTEPTEHKGRSPKRPEYRRAKRTPPHEKILPPLEPREGDAPILPAEPNIGAGDRCALKSHPRSPEAGKVQWHAAVTYPGCEIAVRAELQARGIDTVLPMIRYWRIRNRQRFIDERPLIASVVLFCLDHSCQALVDLFDRFEWDGEAEVLRRLEGPQIAVPVPGIERIVRGASDRWAVLPNDDVWGLRRAILRGEFDGTLRQFIPNTELPPVIQWLLKHGDLPSSAILTHKEARRKGLNFKDAA